MNREEKADLLNELNALFNGAEVIIVSHYKGLTVKEVSELRDNVRKAGAGFRVTKIGLLVWLLKAQNLKI